VKKRTIQRLCLSSLALYLIGGAAFLLILAVLQSACTAAQINNGTCAQSPELIPVFLVFGTATLLLIIAWIAALVRAAQMQSWVWFVVLLFVHGLGLLLYALAGPDDQPSPSQPGTWPGYPPFQPPATSS
jgi:hypothetical protein